MSEAARNFVSTCLTVDPEARPTAGEMLQHSWLTAEVPHFVETEDGEPTDLLPHVRRAFNARRTCTSLFLFRSAKVYSDGCTIPRSPQSRTQHDGDEAHVDDGSASHTRATPIQ